jgi:myxalamid-type polyketide synthase MxaC
MSVELKSRLERSVGQALPSTLTFNYPSVAELAGFFADELFSEAPAAHTAGAPGSEPAQPLSDDIDDMSEDDLAELLAAKLARLQ